MACFTINSQLSKAKKTQSVTGGLSNGKSLKPFYKRFYKRGHLNMYTCVQMFSLTNRADISQG